MSTDMTDPWLAELRLRVTPEEFRRLPRSPAYKYDYVAGEARLTPWPRHYHAVLELPVAPVQAAPEPPAGLLVRPVEEGDFPSLERTFSAAFARVLPFSSLTDEGRLEAARQSLARTVRGEEGPWVRPASFVASEAAVGELLGGTFVTLLPEGNPCETVSYCWLEPPPEDCIVRALGRPHLTWIFVAAGRAAQGIGTALLAASARALERLGYHELLSTFLLGNESSMLWHWRNGFRLLPYPMSLRLIGQRFRARQAEADAAEAPASQEGAGDGILG
jgi:hypothetical protein